MSASITYYIVQIIYCAVCSLDPELTSIYAWLWDMRFSRRASPGATSLVAYPGAHPQGLQLSEPVSFSFPSSPSPRTKLNICYDTSLCRLRSSGETRNYVWPRVWLNSVSASCSGLRQSPGFNMCSVCHMFRYCSCFVYLARYVKTLTCIYVIWVIGFLCS
jgi:hypothetical protein